MNKSQRFKTFAVTGISLFLLLALPTAWGQVAETSSYQRVPADSYRPAIPAGNDHLSNLYNAVTDATQIRATGRQPVSIRRAIYNEGSGSAQRTFSVMPQLSVAKRSAVILTADKMSALLPVSEALPFSLAKSNQITRKRVNEIYGKRPLNFETESHQAQSGTAAQIDAGELAKVHLPFIENQGQMSPQVKFYANTFAGTVFVAEDGLTYAIGKSAASDKVADNADQARQMAAIKEKFLHSNPLEPSGAKRSSAVVNYFVGNQEDWRSNIPAYEVVRLGEVWPAVDVELNAYGKNVEKIFKVRPGGIVADIRLAFEGVRSLSVSEKGELLVETGLGIVSMTKPLAFQDIEGIRRVVEASYFVDGKTYGFAVGHHDPDYTLVIDPLLASTFVGGSTEDLPFDIALDSSGNVFVAGRTQSSNYPTTAGVFDMSFNGGSDDVFVSKLSSDLTTLLASTFIGGGGFDIAEAIALDSFGNVFVAGYTQSSDYPATAGAFDTSFNGNWDIYVSKLSNDLTTLQVSTFLGGSEFDRALDIVFDGSGNIFIAGTSNSSDYPTTAGAFDTSFNVGGTGNDDVVVSKLNGDLSTLLASTFIGGGNTEQPRSIALDSFGNIFITGIGPSGYPTTVGAFDESFNGGFEGFVSKLNSDLSMLLASTYIGGSADDSGNAITLDGSGNVFITGRTGSSDYPAPFGAFDTSFNGSPNDGFVSKLNSDLSLLLASTFIGGSAVDTGEDITLDSSGNVFIAGLTESSNYPTTSGAFDTSLDGVRDVTVSKLSNDLTTLLASTLIGGSNVEAALGITLDGSGHVLVTGPTLSNNFPTTSGAYDTTPNGGRDVFVSRISSNLAAPFIVNSSDDVDDGTCDAIHCSLREALNAANTNPGLDEIDFNISGAGPHTIQPASALPSITDPVIIDGYTQPGASPNTNPPGLGSNAVLQIEIDGSNAGTGASGLTISAGSSTVRGLVINRFNVYGILLDTNGGNVIEGNFIGTDPTGTTALANTDVGVAIGGSTNNRIGGVTPRARNVISGNSLYGVRIGGGTATGNLVQGNYIGTDATGTSALGNIYGVALSDGASNNTIGGTTSAERNLISGNTGHGVLMTESATTGNLVQGNFIGTDVTGTLAVGNAFEGVALQDASGNTIGGTTTGAGNVISGNGRRGIAINAFTGVATNNLVQGNFIGTDVTGTADLGNVDHGVLIDRVPNNTIGGTDAGARNIILGNNASGVDIFGSGAIGNKVQGNMISMNGTHGVGIENGASGTLVQGNFIGTDAAGTVAKGNGLNGVVISGAPDNTIGGAAPGAGNTIAFNGADGVFVESGSGNAVLSNASFSNHKLGIDLGSDGVTANDLGDADAGANNLQNFPVLSSANFTGTTVTIEGTLNSTPTTSFTIQFFGNSICDSAGTNGEGEIFLGSTVVTTDGGGNASFTQAYPITAATGRIISATATDPTNNTSEFSKCQAPDVAVPAGFVFEVFAEGLNEPQGLTFDTGGNLIVAASGSGEIFRFDNDGNAELLAFNFDRPIDVAVDANNILYISDFDTSAIFTINLNTATFPVNAKPVTNLQALFFAPIGPTHLELGPSGNLLVSVVQGATNERVLQVNVAGPTVSDFINLPSGVDHNPQGIAIDANGEMFVALQLLGQVRMAPATATPPIDGGTLPVVLEGLDSPGGIDFGIDGRLFIATRNEVVVSRRNSQSWSTFASGLSGGSFNNLIMRDDGQLFVADFASGRILRMAVPSQQILASENFPFQINQDGDPVITDGSDLTAIRNAFQNWQNVTTSKVSFTDNGTTSLTNASATDGVNLVTFRDQEFLFPPLVLAVTAKTIVFGADPSIAEIVDADIIFNPAFTNHPTFKFGTDTHPGAFDIESTAIHEVGHILGLIHSGVLDASMFFVLQPETEGRSLTLDDRAWASHLYPEPGFATSFGSISGKIEDGENSGAPITGALVLATNLATEDSVHAYSDENGDYLLPGLPAGNYKVLIQPLDGDVGGFPLTPALISAHLQTITNNTDFPEEFYNGGDESGNPATDDPTGFVPVTVNAGTVTSGINFVTNLDLTPPQIAAIFPENNATGVSVTAEILVTFSEPLEVSTFTNATFTLNNGGVSVDGSVLFLDDNQLAVFTPTSPLAFNATYSIAISTGVTDTRGNALATAFNSSFTTEPPDTEAPTVAQIVPAGGASDVFITSNITVVFSEPVNPNSLTASTPSTPGTGSFKLNSTAGEVFGSLTLDLNNTVATFDPEASLAEATTFTITLTQAITDLSGNPLASVFTGTFTTVATAVPAVVNFGPADGATGITVETPILVDFSEPMNVSTFNSNTFKLTTSSQQAQGAFEFLYQDSRVIFRPSSALNFGTTYTVTITTDVQDVSQPPQSLAQTFTSSFTTAAQPVQPAITSVSPPSAFIGTVVAINGRGFDPIPANNVVSFNGVPAVVTQATLNSLTTRVPQDATSGSLTVTVHGVVSNAFQFDVITPAVSANDVVANVPAETGTRDADVTPDGTFAYVTNAGANSVSVIDIVNTIVARAAIQVGDTPLKIAINPQGTLAYVTNFIANTVSVIDIKPGSPTLNQVIATIPVGINPMGVAVTPDGSRVYVAEFTSRGLSVIDADPTSGAFNHVVARVTTETGNRDVEVSPDGTLAFVTGTAGLTIISINPVAPNFNSVVARVSTETGTRDVEVTPDGGLAIVTTMDGDILIIDIHPGTTFASVVARVNTETGSREVEVSPDGTLLYATNFEAGTISVYEFVFTPGATANGVGVNTGGENSPITTTLVGLRLIDIIPVGANPEGIVISPKAQVAVVANSGSNNVSIINVGGFDTPTEGAGDVTGKIEDLVAAGVLNQGQGNALIVKLEGAQKKLDKGQTNAAINQLQAFINQVNDFISAGILTPVQGQALIDLANAIIDQINGGPAKPDLPGEMASEALPKYFALPQNYPNPFNPSTTIAFDIPASAEKGVQVELKVYNILGHSVHTLVDEEKLPGHYTVTWDGTRHNGPRAASGIYILRIKAGEFQQVRKMILLQ